MKLYVLALMMLLQPGSPWKHTYIDTADAIATAAKEHPLYRDDHGFKTAALLVAIAFHESVFKQDAVNPDVGGDSIGLFQVNVSNLPALKMTREELFDPLTGARAALTVLRWSFAACRELPENERLSLYTGGPGCDHGRQESRDMVASQRWLLWRKKPVFIEGK